jgi:hypothetical protein
MPAASVVAPSDAPLASAPPADAPLAAPSLVDDGGAMLPQTEDEPDWQAPLFQQRVRSLLAAIVADDPELARAFFFPLEAYELVKAIDDPARDWERRLWKLFVRDVHAYHAELGDDAAGAELVAFEPNDARKKWMKPHSEGNKLGYWRMTRNTLRVRDARAKEHRFEITSFISWRGEWYVVHLHGYK